MVLTAGDILLAFRKSHPSEPASEGAGVFEIGLAQHWRGASSTPPGIDWDVLLWDLAGDSETVTVPEGFEAWRGEPVGSAAGPSPTGARELLCNMMSIDPANEAEFNAWYDTEHIPRLSAVPGVLSARRFRAVDGRPGYAAIYHLAEAGTVGSDVWRSASTTPWTARIQQLRSDPLRLVLHPR